MKISDVATPNLNNTPSSDWEFINYLDTGSCTKNEISSIQKLFKGEYPSRAKRVVKKNDVIISTVRPNQCHYAILKEPADNMVISTGFMVLTSKENTVPEYLYFFLTQQNITRRLSIFADGATTSYPSINPEDILNLEINLPDKTEQKKIADILSAIDDKISLNNRINTELEQMAKTVYNYWFVQFDFPTSAVYAASVGKPHLKGKPYKVSGGAMEYNEELKREIPKGWKIGTFNSVAEIFGGSTPSTAVQENFCKDGTAWITPKDLAINDGKKYITKGETDVSEIGLKSASLKVMPERTVLMSSRAPIGYVAISRKDVTTNQGFKSFIPRDGYSSIFTYFLVKSYIPSFIQMGSGSTFKEIPKSTLEEIKIVIPPKPIIKSLTSQLSPIFEKQNILELENQELITLRDFLLPLLMNGQVNVK